jgi:NEDD8-activating enzyme E1 regulatory subunit
MTEVVVDKTPPILHEPSDKEKKYDRQLRLWAKSGQEALENAHILLLNSGSGTVGVETLKNLVLPGMYLGSSILRSDLLLTSTK